MHPNSLSSTFIVLRCFNLCYTLPHWFSVQYFFCAIFLLCISVTLCHIAYCMVQCAMFLLCYFGMFISVTLCHIAWFSVQYFFCAILGYKCISVTLCRSIASFSVQCFFCAILVCLFLLHYAVLHGSVCNISFVLFWFVYFCYTMPYCMVQCAIFLLCYSNSLYSTFIVLRCFNLCYTLPH